MTRVAMKDYTFSDGTFIPKGTFVSAAVTPMHNDEEYYADATVFNPWRFAELRDGEGESLKHQMASTNKEYLAFGHGKDAWYAFPYRTLLADINALSAVLDDSSLQIRLRSC